MPRAHPRNVRLAELERELLQVRSEGRATHEEMQTSQEELRSANEELQSTNEELQIAIDTYELITGEVLSALSDSQIPD